MWKSIVKIMSSNIIYVLFGVIINFLLPKFLSQNSYALQKEFIFYLSYAGLLSLGFTDGIFEEYGGKKPNAPLNIKIAQQSTFYFLLQFFIGIIIGIFGFLLKQNILLICAIGVFAINIINYYKNLCIATGEYSLFSLNTCFEKLATCILFCTLIFLFKADHYIWYCLSYILIWFIGIIYFMRGYHRKWNVPFFEKADFNGSIQLMQKGIPFMFGNLSYSLLSGLDRWFVKIFMQNLQFAMYSFAISMEQVINAFLTPIGNVLYNRICLEKSDKNISMYKKLIYIWSYTIISGAFLAKEIVKIFLPKYISSLDLIFILFLSQIANIVIAAIYLNIYRSEEKSGEMTAQIIVFLVAGAILNLIGYTLYPSMISFAVTTLFVRFIWLSVCILRRRKTFSGWRTVWFVLINSMSFIAAGTINNGFIGLGIYISIMSLTAFLLMRDGIYFIMKIIFKR